MSKVAVCARLETMLLDAKACRVFQSKDTVWFRGGTRPVINTNILNPFGTGYIQVEEVVDQFVLRYRASTFPMLMVVLLQSFFFALMVFWFSLRQQGVVPMTMAVFFCVFFVFFGLNYFIAAFRFPRWIWRGLEETAFPTGV